MKSWGQKKIFFIFFYTKLQHFKNIFRKFQLNRSKTHQVTGMYVPAHPTLWRPIGAGNDKHVFLKTAFLGLCVTQNLLHQS